MTERTRSRIREIPEEERPRERLARYGAQSCSDADLLAIILRTGSVSEGVQELAYRLISECRGLQALGEMDLDAMTSIKGLGPAKATSLLAAFELGRRSAGIRIAARAKISSPSAAANLVMGEMSRFDREQLWVILLDTKKQSLGIDKTYTGSVSSAPVRIAELFHQAIVDNADAVIMVHNHPSGDPTPSPEDVEVTRKAIEAGRLLEIEVVDHVVIGANRFFSFKEKRLVFDN